MIANSTESLQRFEPGKSYGVWYLDDTPENVTIASRSGSTLHLTDGRSVKALPSLATDDSDSEAFHLPREGRARGVVRVCHEIETEAA